MEYFVKSNLKKKLLNIKINFNVLNFTSIYLVINKFIWIVKVGKNATTNYIKFWQLPQKPLSSFIKKERIITNRLSNNHD